MEKIRAAIWSKRWSVTVIMNLGRSKPSWATLRYFRRKLEFLELHGVRAQISFSGIKMKGVPPFLYQKLGDLGKFQIYIQAEISRLKWLNLDRMIGWAKGRF